MKRLIIILILIFALPVFAFAQNQTLYPSGGTSIFCLVNNKDVFISLDSKKVMFTKNGMTPTVDCKIGHNKQFYYATAGRVISIYTVDGEQVFDVLKTIKNISTKYKGYQNVFEKSSEAIRDTLQALIPKMKRKPELYDSIKNRIVLQTIIYSFDPTKKPVLYMVEYEITETDSIKMHVAHQSNVGHTYISVLGYREKIDEFRFKYPKYFLSQKTTLKDKLSHMIELEMAAHPDLIGKPIRVLHFNANEYDWLTPDCKCF